MSVIALIRDGFRYALAGCIFVFTVRFLAPDYCTRIVSESGGVPIAAYLLVGVVIGVFAYCVYRISVFPLLHRVISLCVYWNRMSKDRIIRFIPWIPIDLDSQIESMLQKQKPAQQASLAARLSQVHFLYLSLGMLFAAELGFATPGTARTATLLVMSLLVLFVIIWHCRYVIDECRALGLGERRSIEAAEGEERDRFEGLTKKGAKLVRSLVSEIKHDDGNEGKVLLLEIIREDSSTYRWRLSVCDHEGLPESYTLLWDVSYLPEYSNPESQKEVPVGAPIQRGDGVLVQQVEVQRPRKELAPGESLAFGFVWNSRPQEGLSEKFGEFLGRSLDDSTLKDYLGTNAKPVGLFKNLGSLIS